MGKIIGSGVEGYEFIVGKSPADDDAADQPF